MSISSGFFLALLWLSFSYIHLKKYLATGEVALLFLVVAETTGAAFYLLRTAPSTVSERPLDWLIAVCGTFSTLLFRPSTDGVLPFASHFIIPGTIMLIFGLASLNRSFALVPAKRVLKTKMMYRYVRHPLYSSYFVIFVSYVLANTSVWNIIVLVALLALLLARIYREESHLMKDPAYRAYAEKTRYKLVPFIY